jgi:cystathionine beta-lyase/cystathionine gamma-synthase
VKGGDERALRVLGRLSIIRQPTSLGGVETLASPPYNTLASAHYNTSRLGLTPEQLVAAGIQPGDDSPVGWPRASG